MAARIQNMTEGRPGKLIFSFALPLMVGNVFQQLYTVVDTMVVGKYLGVGALAALGAADWMNWMMLGIVQGFAQGCAIRMSREFGAGDYAGLRDVIGNAGVLSALFSLLLAGAVGTLIDRACRGYVVDMFNVLFMRFAVFNVADICVVVGGIAAGLYYMFLMDKLEPREEAPHEQADADR